jgi:ribonuclease J
MCGIGADNLFIMETGDVLELDQHGARVVEPVSEGHIVVDGNAINDFGQDLMRDRRTLAHNGFLIVVATLDKYTGGLVGDPQLATRGFVYQGESADLLERAKEEIAKVIELGGSRAEVAERLKMSLGRLAYSETGRRPIVLPVINRI